MEQFGRGEWEKVMRRMFLKLSAIALLMNLAAYAQSLGDVARENREKQNAEAASGTQPKVITNQDLPADPDGYQGPPETEPAADTGRAADHRLEQRLAQQSLAEQRTGEQFKRQILTQENRIAELQDRIDLLNASIHSVGSVQYDRPSNRYQARQLLRVAQMQQQLDEQRRKLATMQEAARHAGMHTVVYDP
jgi:hypothetical protein